MATLSHNAELIANAAYSHYKSASVDRKYFDDFSQFSFDNEELLVYCQELEKYSLVIIEYYDDGQMYLFINYPLIQYKESGILREIIQE